MLVTPLKILRKNVIGKSSLRFLSSASLGREFEETPVIVDKVGEITTIGLNRPEKRNAIDTSLHKLLAEAIENYEKDESSCVGIIHGIGGNFCAGDDLKYISEEKHCDVDPDPAASPLGFPLKLIKKPLVAAISGYAVASGFELALMCDLRVVEQNAVMGFYNRRFGIPTTNGGTVRLSALVGLSRALDLLLTGRSLTGDEAFQWGLANRVVACGTALGQAIQLAGSLTKFPQHCLLKDRESLYESAFSRSLQSLLQYEKENAAEILRHGSNESAKKFLELGIGKHGKTYDLKEKAVPDWEKK